VPVSNPYKAHLDLASINLKVGGLTLHDGDMPLRQLGLGSRRMLLCGIQQMGLEEGHITLFDEVEFGLEPHRITRLYRIEARLKDATDQPRFQARQTGSLPVLSTPPPPDDPGFQAHPAMLGWLTDAPFCRDRARGPVQLNPRPTAHAAPRQSRSGRFRVPAAG